MSSFLKWAGVLLCTMLVLTLAFALHSWYFRPLNINIFFERAFLQFMLEDPEAVSSLGVFAQFGYKGFDGRLTDVSPEHERKLAHMARNDLQTLHGYDRASLSPAKQLSYDVLEWFLEDQVAGEQWLEYDYPVNQLFGVQSSTPDFMVQIHPIGDERDVRNYIERLRGFRRKFEQVLAGLELRQARGIVPPAFVLSEVLAEMRAFIAVPPTDNVLYVNLKDKMARIGGLSAAHRADLLSMAAQAVQADVYPAYRALIDFFARQQTLVTGNDGVWHLPDGDRYYDYLVRSH